MSDYCYYALNSVLSSYEYIWMAEFLIYGDLL